MFSFLNKNFKKLTIAAMVVLGLLGGNLALAQKDPAGGAPGPTNEAAGGGFGTIGNAINFLINPVGAVTDAALKATGVIGEDAAGPSNMITAGILATLLKLLGFLVMGVNYLLAALGTALFTFGGFLVELGIKWNADVINSSIVETGWTLVRNFTNLGFILAIIYISFVIMLRIETYEIKKVVAKLLLAAVFINFSLTIVGIFLGASDTVSNFFISKATGEASLSRFHEFAKNIAGVTNFQSLSKVGADIIGAAKNGIQPDLSVGYIAVLVRLVMVVMFVALSNIVIFLLAFMMLLRYFVLTALLIIAPAAWLCFAVPKLYPYFTKWWNVVLKWIFFLPVTAFFLYLAIVVVYNPGEKSASGSPATIVKQVANAPDYFSDVTGNFEQFGQMVLSLALMITGLIAGEKLGVMGAAGTLAGAKSLQDWTVGKIKAAPEFGFRRALTGFQEKDDKGNIKSTLGQRLAIRASSLGLSGIAQTFDKYGSVDLKAPVDKQQKKYEGYNDSSLLLFAQDANKLSDAGAAGLAKVLASKKLLNKLSDAQIEVLAKKSEVFGVNKEIYSVRPDLAPDPEKVLQGMGPGKKVDLSPRVFYDPVNPDNPRTRAVILSLKDADLAKMGQDGTPEQKAAIRATFDLAYNAFAAGGQAPGGLSASEITALDRVDKFINNNPGLGI